MHSLMRRWGWHRCRRQWGRHRCLLRWSWALVSGIRSIRGWSASSRRLSQWYGFSLLHGGGFESVDADTLLPVSDLYNEVFFEPPEDSVGTGVRGLEGRLLGLAPDENESCFGEIPRDMRLRVAVVTCRDWFESSNLVAEMSEVLIGSSIGSLQDEIPRDC